MERELDRASLMKYGLLIFFFRIRILSQKTAIPQQKESQTDLGSGQKDQQTDGKIDELMDQKVEQQATAMELLRRELMEIENHSKTESSKDSTSLRMFETGM